MPVTATRRPRALAALAATLAAVVTLAGCSSDGGSGDGAAPTSTTPAAATDAFPVTIPSALGSATIEKKPERVVTWGWSAQDAVLALGVVPAAMPKYTYGGDAQGVLPWDAEKITALGGTTPTILSGADTGEVPFEEIVAAKPDVILAPYSGLTQEDYDKLAKIAPTVAYPDQPWATTWQDVTTIVGKALGLKDQAKQLVADTDAYVTKLGGENPVLKDKTFVYGAANQADQLTVYKPTDPRVQLLNQLGMTTSPSVAALDPKKDDSYFYTVSYENVSKIDTDVLVAYFDDQAAADKFASDPLIAAMPSVKSGAFAPIVGQSFVMASSAPSALSIPWMLDKYVPQLAAAAEKAQ
jgi:iron complex transport system substrate-binding protein